MIGSLFSGIGGLELGLERAGLGPVAWQVEIDPFCRAVLAEHWPRATRYTNVCSVSALDPVDLICGGFPCQDVSAAGRGAGIDGARSGLWREFRRVVALARPRLVVVENVASGKRRWLPTVRGDLHVLGYRSVAVEVSAFDVGAPQRRTRVFVVASNADRDAVWLDEQWLAPRRARGVRNEGQAVARGAGGEGVAADADRERRTGAGREDPRGTGNGDACGADPLGRGNGGDWTWERSGEQWTALAPVCGVAHGVPRRLDRLRALGNAVVPQCAEAVGRMIAAGLEEVS